VRGALRQLPPARHGQAARGGPSPRSVTDCMLGFEPRGSRFDSCRGRPDQDEARHLAEVTGFVVYPRVARVDGFEGTERPECCRADFGAVAGPWLIGGWEGGVAPNQPLANSVPRHSSCRAWSLGPAVDYHPSRTLISSPASRSHHGPSPAVHPRQAPLRTLLAVGRALRHRVYFCLRPPAAP
jgi:hypothetical protein